MAFIHTRRGFLQGSAVLAMAELSRSLGWSTEAPVVFGAVGSPIRLGVASYSFRKFGIPDVIRFMKELKYSVSERQGHAPPNDQRRGSEEGKR